MPVDAETCIRREDCPPGTAPLYPGKKSKDNPGGTKLSRSEFADRVITDWVKFFKDKDRYRSTPWSVKSTYLIIYMKPLGVGYQTAKTKLLDIERLIAEGELLETKNEEMEIDYDEVKDFMWAAMNHYEKDKEVDKWLALSDDKLFDGELKCLESVKKTRRYIERAKIYYLGLSDTDLFKKYENISLCIKDMPEFKLRHKQFAEVYMEEHFQQSSSQEILEQMSQTPKVVQISDPYKERLQHLTHEQRSEKLVIKNIKDTVKELNKTPEGRKQAKIVLAGVSHPVYGDPGLGLKRMAKEEAKRVKGNLLSGKETTLKVDIHKPQQSFPDNVYTLAKEHWLENTIPEPAKHTGRAIVVEGETVPTRYQDKTDRECYENFKDDCREKIRVEMTKAAKEMRQSPCVTTQLDCVTFVNLQGRTFQH